MEINNNSNITTNLEFSLRLQLLLNRRLFIIKEITQDLYERVEENILYKIQELEDKVI